MSAVGFINSRGFAATEQRPDLPDAMPREHVLTLPVTYSEAPGGLVRAVDSAGVFVGQFASRKLAEATVDFLSR